MNPNHIKILSEALIECTKCNGDGYTSEHDNYDHMNGCDERCPIAVHCENCHGEGYYITKSKALAALEMLEGEMIEKFEPYLRHEEGCHHDFNLIHPINTCTCGLDQLKNK